MYRRKSSGPRDISSRVGILLWLTTLEQRSCLQIQVKIRQVGVSGTVTLRTFYGRKKLMRKLNGSGVPGTQVGNEGGTHPTSSRHFVHRL